MLETRPWGSYRVLCDEEQYKVKELRVNPDSRLSLQSHQCRTEYWTVVQGEAIATLHDREMILELGDSLFIPENARHRLANEGDEELIIIEVQMGRYLGEDDIQRYEDDYGRC